MPKQVCTGAQLQCSFGMAPSVFNATPRPVLTSQMPAGTIMDHVPMMNIMPFGMCTSLANPTVASATAAALGVLTPMPCIPVTTAPWVPGVPNVLITNQPALDNNCKLMCNWGGVISVLAPGQFTHDIP
jgi:hypothetical protein